MGRNWRYWWSRFEGRGTHRQLSPLVGIDSLVASGKGSDTPEWSPHLIDKTRVPTAEINPCIGKSTSTGACTILPAIQQFPVSPHYSLLHQLTTCVTPNLLMPGDPRAGNMAGKEIPLNAVWGICILTHLEKLIF